MVRPYQKISLNYLGKELRLSVEDVESMLIDLITTGKLNALINQPQRMLILESRNSINTQAPLLKWIDALEALGNEVVEQYC
jgi:COP9 signalosome complex subunit 2